MQVYFIWSQLTTNIEPIPDSMLAGSGGVWSLVRPWPRVAPRFVRGYENSSPLGIIWFSMNEENG